MPRNQSQIPSDPIRTIKKILLSGFVVFSFMMYVVIERLTRPDSPLYPAATATSIVAAPPTLAPFPSAPGAPPPTDSPFPTVAQAPTQNSSAYKNGTYQGPPVDA